MTVGEKIRHARKTKGITQNELAAKLGITRSAVGQFEKGNSHPRAETLAKIAAALDVPAYEFSLNEGERIKAARELNGLTREELGLMAGLTGKQIADIEMLDFRPSNEVALKLADALNIPSSELVPGTIQLKSIHEEHAITNAEDGLKAIIKKLFDCEEDGITNGSKVIENAGMHFTRDNQTYVLNEQDFKNLIPLVDGLVTAYVEQKKMAVS